jgi:N-acetylmuramoyl-L-alanine amidase
MHRTLGHLIYCLCLWSVVACDSKTPPSAPPVAKPEVRPNLAPLGQAPDWLELQPYDGTIARSDFERLLTTVYALPGAALTTITMDENVLKVRKQSHLPLTEPNGTLELRFGNQPKPNLRYWRSREEIPPSTDPARPLAGVRIALDPGHIGGEWARLEERFFQPETGPAICEGSLTLLTAKLLQPLLEALGATVTLVRDRTEPLTAERPKNLLTAARHELDRLGIDPANPPSKAKIHTVEWQAEKLFYRTAEIRARAKLVNESLRPDVVVCLHFNAAGTWGSPSAPTYSQESHLHLLLNGAFSLDELTHDDERHEMLLRLLSGVHETELALAECVASTLSESTGLPPFTYHAKALPVPGQPYVWARNLLANRLYKCPVVYCEPFIMNHQETSLRLQAGDYEGIQDFNGTSHPSLFRQYAHGVLQGLLRYYAPAH